MMLVYLISAYRQPRQLARLLGRLQQPNARFVVHLDAKVAAKPFLDALPATIASDVTFVAQPVRVYWKGFSQVRMMQRLMETALAAPFDYAIYLSEADYPLRTNEQLNVFFAQQPPDLLAYWRLRDRPTWQHKLRYFYFHDWPWLNPRTNQLTRLLFRIYNQTVKRVLPRRRFPTMLEPFGGSEYMCLTRRSVEYVVNFSRQAPTLMHWYRFSDSPIEHVFHTILLNAPFRDTVIHWAEYEHWSANLTDADRARSAEPMPESVFHRRYIDWSPDRERPAILDRRDAHALLNTDALFARKFDQRRSARLLDLLDSMSDGTAFR